MVTILVTGANRGIGLAIAQATGSQVSDATVLIGCRSTQSGHEAIEKLQAIGISAKFELLQVTITDDVSIKKAVETVQERHGKLDVLINNAGSVSMPESQEPADLRKNWAEGLNCLFISQVLVTKAFIPLLRKSPWGRVIMVSSARGSLSRNRALDMPPSQHWAYDCSKAALNLAMIEFRNAEYREATDQRSHLTYWAVGPGHCKTGFNNFRGTKDPLEGAEVVMRLLESRRGEIPSGTFWEFEYGTFQQVAW
ncbi:hypothetical protein BX600DRAFT_12639 [Xylariales sp. PMI_506]|nr:hypothetical protein BX600DRAFT_12639 [Xylariales sp. PMI_506]